MTDEDEADDSVFVRKIRVVGKDGRPLAEYVFDPYTRNTLWGDDAWINHPDLTQRPMGESPKVTMTQRIEFVPRESLPKLTDRQQRHMDALSRLQLQKCENDLAGVPTHPVIQELMAELGRWVTLTDEELGREMAREMHDRMMERLSTPPHLEMPKGWMRG